MKRDVQDAAISSPYHGIMNNKSKVDAFIDRWQGITGSEKANYQLFITGRCDLLELPQPEPARGHSL